MKKLSTLFLLVALTVPTLTGCFHNQIIVEKNYNASATQPDWANNWRTYLLFGLVPLSSEPIGMTEVCPQGAGIVETKKSFLNGLLSGILVNILSFEEAKITCAKAPK